MGAPNADVVALQEVERSGTLALAVGASSYPVGEEPLHESEPKWKARDLP